tara:strand:- start:346 stop:633 length:288 start_codon:yes stop_codon:yes gene_type:complete
MKKDVGVDIDGDGKPDLNLDLKTLILVIGGVVSITMTYSSLSQQIELNKAEIEVAKKLPPAQSHDIIDQKLLFLEQHIENESARLDKLEDKIYKR